jgi:LPS-assembly protein
LLPDFDTKEITPSYSQLFKENRFVGGDRISDDHRLSLGLSTSLTSQENGNEKFRASLAQAIYFDDRQVTLSDSNQTNSNLQRKKSDLAFELFFRLNNQWRLNNEAVYNNQDKHWEKAATSLYYNNQDKLFNISYKYSTLDTELYSVKAKQLPIEQLDMSFYIPMGNDLSWVGRWHHDFTNNRELEVFSGFEYNNCCWRAGLVVRRWLDRQNERLMSGREPELRNGIFLQIQFKGIAGASGRVASILKKGIYGYEPLEKF